jgi:hypothetical protein
MILMLSKSAIASNRKIGVVEGLAENGLSNSLMPKGVPKK